MPGVGLAVARPEVSIDDSTQIRIFDISNTFMAKSAMEDAIKYSLDSKDAIRTHGGFEMARKIAVALRGTVVDGVAFVLALLIDGNGGDGVRR